MRPVPHATSYRSPDTMSDRLGSVGSYHLGHVPARSIRIAVSITTRSCFVGFSCFRESETSRRSLVWYSVVTFSLDIPQMYNNCTPLSSVGASFFGDVQTGGNRGGLVGPVDPVEREPGRPRRRKPDRFGRPSPTNPAHDTQRATVNGGEIRHGVRSALTT